MEKCIVTKYFGSLNEEGLDKYDRIKFKVSSSSVKITTNNQDLEIPEFVTVTHESGDAQNKKLYTSLKTPYYIYIPNKYNISSLFINETTGGVSFETSQLIGAKNLTDIYLNTKISGTIDDVPLNEGTTGITLRLSTGEQDVEGNISRFSDLTTLQYLQLVDCKDVCGNLLSLKKLTSLTNLGVVGTKISGDLVAFAAAQISYGRNNATFANMSKLNYHHAFRFNNTDFSYSPNNILSWVKSEDNYIVSLEQDESTLTVTITNPANDGTYTVVS